FFFAACCAFLMFRCAACVCFFVAIRGGYRRGSSSKLRGGRSERVGQALDAAVPHGDYVERRRERRELGMRREPGLRGAADAALLLRADHLDRIAEALAELLLHLDEGEPAAAADDEVELVAGDPDVLAEDAVAAQPVPAARERLRFGAPHAVAASRAAASSSLR